MNNVEQSPPATLIATLGTEPQVVTATLDLLRRQGERMARAVVLHTTAPGTPIAEAVEVLRAAFEGPHDPGDDHPQRWSAGFRHQLRYQVLHGRGVGGG